MTSEGFNEQELADVRGGIGRDGLMEVVGVVAAMMTMTAVMTAGAERIRIGLNRLGADRLHAERIGISCCLRGGWEGMVCIEGGGGVATTVMMMEAELIGIAVESNWF
jgi:hypothetical protein